MSTDVRTAVPFSVVPEEHRWLSAMFAAMLRVGIPVRDAVPGDRTLQKFFPFTIERSRASEQAGSIVEVMVRTTSKCNQFCPFCSAPQHDNPSEEVLCACLDAVSEMMPGAMVSLTGGEPTLRASLLTEVKPAVSLPGIRLVQVQTNAVGFGSI